MLQLDEELDPGGTMNIYKVYDDNSFQTRVFDNTGQDNISRQASSPHSGSTGGFVHSTPLITSVHHEAHWCSFLLQQN